MVYPSKRVTNADVTEACQRINKALNRPLTYSDRSAPAAGENYKFKANVGHFHHWASDYGHNLAVVMNEGGGISIVLGAATRRALVEKLDAYLKGIYQVQYGTTSSSVDMTLQKQVSSAEVA